MISQYRMALLQGIDGACVALALLVCGHFFVEPDLFVFTDYTGASLFTLFCILSLPPSTRQRSSSTSGCR